MPAGAWEGELPILERIIEREVASVVLPSIVEGELGSNGTPAMNRTPSVTMRLTASELGTPFLAGTPKSAKAGGEAMLRDGGDVGGRNEPSIERTGAAVGEATNVDKKAPSADMKEASVGRKAPLLEGKAAGAIVGWARRRLHTRVPKPESQFPVPHTLTTHPYPETLNHISDILYPNSITETLSLKLQTLSLDPKL